MFQGDEIAEWKYTEAYTIRSSLGRFCGTYKVKYTLVVNTQGWGAYHIGKISLVPIVERCKCLKEADIFIQNKIREDINKIDDPESTFFNFHPSVYVLAMNKLTETYNYFLLPKHEFIFNDILSDGIGVIKIVIRGSRSVESLELISKRPGTLTYEQKKILEYVQGRQCKEYFAQALEEVRIVDINWDLTKEKVRGLLQKVLDERQEIYRDQYEDYCYWVSEAEEERKEKEYIKDQWKEKKQYMSKSKSYYSVPVIKPKYNAKRLKR